MQKYIYLSPHLDDAILSNGAVIWDLVRRRIPVEVWTIFAGDPPAGNLSPFAREIHQRWQTGASAPAARRGEDQLACERLQVEFHHFEYPDCIYRTLPGSETPLIQKNEDLFQVLPATESALVDEITQNLTRLLPKDAFLVVPLGMGRHIDHQIVRKAGEQLGLPLFYYPDFPYAANHPEELDLLAPKNFVLQHFPLSNLALAAWQYAVEAYVSQISTFWPSLSEMYAKIEEYAHSPIGNCLLQVSV